MTQVLTNLKEVMICREITYGTSRHVSTSDGAASDASHWQDAEFGATSIDGVNDDGDYYIGYLLIPVTGTAGNIGKVRRITGWDDVADEFTLDSALPGTPQAADTAWIVKQMRTRLGSAKYNRDKIPREYQSLTHERPSPVAGKPSGDLEFTTEWLAAMTGNALEELFLATLGSELQDYSGNTSLVVAGGDTSNIWITDGDYTKFTEKGLIAIEADDGTFDVRPVTDIDQSDGAKDILSISPPISSYPSAGNAVECLQCYTGAEEDHISLTIIVVKNSQYWVFTGCRGTVKSSELNTGGYPELQFTMKADDVTRTASAWTGNVLQSTQEPPSNYGGILYDGTSALEATKCGFDAGVVTSEKPVFNGTTGRSEWANVDRQSKANVSVYLENDTEITKYDDNTTVNLFGVMGDPANAAGAVAFHAEACKITDAPIGDQEGQEVLDFSLDLFDDNTDADEASKLVVGWLKT